MLEFITGTFLGKMLSTFLIGMVPIIELRGAIPYGVSLGLPALASAAAAILGNLVPVPIIILFARRVLLWMRKKSRRLSALAEKLENRARGRKLYRGELIGLCVFVAIPLPGTGAWTGALIAAVLGLRLKLAFPAIAAGVVMAGLVVTALTYGIGALL